MHHQSAGNAFAAQAVTGLGAVDARDRRSAAQVLAALGDVGQVGPSALAAMAERAVADPEPSVRYALLSALEHAGWEAAEHLDTFVALLDGEDQIAQARAAWAIGRIGPAAHAAVPALARVATDAGRLIDPRWSAAVALQRLGSTGAAAAPVLLDTLGDPDADMREASARALGAVAPEAEHLPALLATLADPDHLVRESAAEGLAAFGPEAPAAARAALGERLDDAWPTVRRAAGAALAAMGVAVAPAPMAAGPPREAARVALAAHLDGLRSTAERTRGISTFEIGKLGPEAAEAVPLLARLLTHDANLDVRWSAAWGLGRMEHGALQAVPALLRSAACDPDPDVRGQACWALGALPADLVPAVRVGALQHALADEDSLVREEAATGLGRLGWRARPALAPLARAVADPHPLVALRALKALDAVGAPDPADRTAAGRVRPASRP